MLFTPKLTVINDNGEKRTMNNGGVFGQSVYIVPRSDCAFRRYRLRGDKNSALKAASFKAQSEARRGHDGLKIIKEIGGKFASVWTFNSAGVHGIRSLPESLCYVPLSHGYRLVKCLIGIEGQVWNDNQLLASRWWHNEPSVQEWEAFIRVSPIEFDNVQSSKPDIETIAFRDNIPLFGYDKFDLNNIVSPGPAAIIVSCLSLFFLSFASAKYGNYRSQLSTIEVQKSEISSDTNLILSKRRKALANRASVSQFQKVEPDYSLTEALAALSAVLRNQNISLRELRLRTNEIEFRLLGAKDISMSELVADLEKTLALTNVNVSNDRGSVLVIKAQIGGVTGTSSVNNGGAQ